jgi:hypothetical protein
LAAREWTSALAQLSLSLIRQIRGHARRTVTPRISAGRPGCGGAARWKQAPAARAGGPETSDGGSETTRGGSRRSGQLE